MSDQSIQKIITFNQDGRKLTVNDLSVANQILQTIPDLVFITSHRGDIYYVKPDSEEQLAYPAEEILGKNLADLSFPNELLTLCLTKLKECHETQKVVVFKYSISLPNLIGHYEARAIPFDTDKVIVMIRNRTLEEDTMRQLKERETSLHTLNEDLLKQRNDYIKLSENFQQANEVLSQNNQEIEKLLRQNLYHERILNQILENSPSGIFTYNCEMQITMMNPSMQLIFSDPEGELSGMYLKDFVEDPVLFAALSSAAAGTSGFFKGWYTSKRTGQRLYGHVKTFPLHDYKNPEIIIGGTAIITNLTDWKQASDKLQEREEDLLVTLNSIGDGVIVTSETGHIQLLNPVAQRLTGYQPEEAQSRHISQVLMLQNDHSEKAETLLDPVFTVGTTVTITHQLQMVSRNNERYQISFTASPIRNRENRISGAIIVFQDVTDQYKMFQRIMLSDIRQKALIQNSPLGVLLMHESGQILEVNNAALAMLGSPSAEATKRINVLEFEPLVKAGFGDDFLNCIKNKSQIEAERQYITKWGKEVYVKYFFNPIILPETEENGVLCSIVDITEQKLSEEREINYTHSLKHLSDTAISFLELAETEDPFLIIGNKLKELTEIPFIILKRCDDDKNYEMAYTHISDDIMNMMKEAGFSTGTFRVSAELVHQRNISRYFQQIKTGFEAFISSAEEPLQNIYKSIGAVDIYTIDFIWESRDFGNATFLLPQNTGMKNIQAVETFINQASLLLQKRDTAIRLRQQNDLYMASVNAIADNFFILDEKLNLVFINQTFNKVVSNFTQGRDIIGLNVFDTFPFLDGSIREAYQKIIDTHQPNAGVFHFDVGPRVMYIDSNSVPIIENNKIRYIITTFRDITAQREYENKIKELKEFNEKIIESIRDGIAVINEQNEIIFTNPAFERILQLKSGSSVGRKWTDMIVDIPLDDFSHQPVIDVKNLIRSEMTLKTGKGDILNALITISPADMSNKAFILLLTDITERKIIESNLLNAKETAEVNSAKVTAVIENTSDNIWAFDREYNIIYLNNIFQKEFQATFGVLLEPGINLLKSLPESMQHFWKDRYDKVLAGERLLFEDVVNAGKQDIYIQVSMNPIVKEGEIIGGSCFGSNITPRKLAEIELKTAKEKAEESDRLKTAFLSNMSHEIRTPLNSIIGFSYLLQNRTVPPEKQKVYLQQINSSSQMLLRLIQDIIDISKIEAGQLSIETTVFDIRDLFNEIFQHFQNEIGNSRKPIVLICKNRDTSHPYASDYIRIKQVLSNLLSNALKFTDSGSIEFGYQVDKNTIRFFVSDTGIGIKEEFRNNLFQRFSRISTSYTHETRGTGLGLAICRNIIELMGGEINFRSVFRKGSEFYFTLPYKKADPISIPHATVAPPAITTDRGNATVLIAEDDDVNFMFIQEFLSEYNLRILRAENGEQAVLLHQQNPDIAIVLMDLQMPLMDGLEATRKIRESDLKTPIIAQTAYAFSTERKACIEAGCNDYISKPIVQEELLDKIKIYLKRKG